MSVAGSIELQMISKILTSQDAAQVEILCGFGPEYYDILQPHIKFILQHKETYGNVPDVFTFQAEFNDINLVAVSEDTEYPIITMRSSTTNSLWTSKSRSVSLQKP